MNELKMYEFNVIWILKDVLYTFTYIYACIIINSVIADYCGF